ncbi:putative phosphohydrolase [Mariniflexile fucanivorans]|uniref:Putative phosphohydrolase n=1 Tax=Mariniflexile fucanivorans TaxID=264023 RepID=A0A4R1REJ5_9FLAO|nr:metallophosphoesterase [Mariniflexile fucanivorans]TCL64050.1 putative phosphohydrolase [Mariniflexile fucanivorans]
MNVNKIQYASDLHLEFPKNKEFFNANPLVPSGDILILAGDIVPFVVLDKHQDFFSFLSDNFQMTYWIPGNHEYYYFDAATKPETFYEEIRSNVILLNNSVVHYQNTKLIFSTLWSKISLSNQWSIERGLSDFHVINYHGHKLTTDDYNQLHTNCINFINQELQKNDADKTIVVTHHVPTFKKYPKIYKNSALNEAFAVELFDVIEASNVDYWIYGHSHHNTKDFKIGRTQMRTNQLGYIQRNENERFDPKKYFNI